MRVKGFPNVEQLNREHRRTKHRKRIFGVLAAFVMLATIYALIIPALTLLSDDAATQSDGGYWKQVSSIDDTSVPYLIVPSSAADYAFGLTRSGNSYNGTRAGISLAQVATNAEYYTGDVAESAQWTFSGSGNTFTIKNVSYSSYGLRLSNNTYISTSTTDNTLTYDSSSQAWTIGYNNYYLIYRNNSFSRSRNYSTARPMLIYKYVESLPDSGGDSGGNSDADVPSLPLVKPDYPEYIEDSDEKSGITAVGTVDGSYVSDSATSKIEELFTGIAEDDGKVLTDKSVIYGDDDYEAFASYDSNTFGVALSALGQDYSLSEEFNITTPLDVVFVLDTSGSMINGRTSDNKSCAAAMIEALNDTMTEIYSINENNRVGVVCYSGQGHKLLDLGRYTATDGEFFPEEAYTSNTTTLSPSSSIQSVDGTSFETGSFNKWYGTYTQSGIAKGAEMLLDADTTFTGTLTYTEDGETVTSSYTVRRRPIMILLSDGDPTYSTSEYNNVLNATNIYGDGTASNTTNNQGIHGYYTILSAQHYKNKVSSHYNVNTSFYTVGLGISETATSDSSGSSVTGDHYKRAVLNPSDENIADLNNTYSDDTNASTTSKQLYRLLNNTYSGSTITVGRDTQNYDTYGLPKATSSTIPVVSNPYVESGYHYDNGTYFSENFTSEELAEEFKSVVQAAADIPVYGFVLKKHTSVSITDNIGEGMEIKGIPVVRYGGVNYQPTSTEQTETGTVYHYSGTYTATDGSGDTVDFSDITVAVSKTDGKQSVVFSVPDQTLPTYSPNISATGETLFYFEELPVRCIYQVGLTTQAQQSVDALKAVGGELAFYTNSWSDSDKTVATLTPTAKNPYYSVQYDTATVAKANNATETAEYVLSFGNDSTSNIQQYLGNNGKLVFSVLEHPITINKEWDGSVLPSEYKTVNVKLYLVKDDDITFTASEVDGLSSIPLSSDNSWTASFDVPIVPVGYHYYIVELDADGFNPVFSDSSGTLTKQQILIDGVPVTAAKIENITSDMQFTVKNFKTVELPATGGVGTIVFTAAGIALMIFAVVLLIIKIKRK